MSGDYGYAGSAELALGPNGLPSLLKGSELYVFGDGGKVWYRSRFGFPTSESHLASVGGGVRFKLAERALLQLEATRGLNNPIFFKYHKKTKLFFSIRSLF